MNSVERVSAALRREQPDRVPIMESIIDERVARAILPDMKDISDFMDRMDMDAVSCRPNFARVHDNEDGTYVDEWGVTYKSGEEEIAHPLRGPVQTMDDAVAYTPPDPDAPHRLISLKENVSRYKGKRTILFHHRDAFMWSAYVMGMDNLLAALLAEPELATLVMDKVFETNLKIALNAVRAGAEVIVIADDYAHNSGPLMSPAIMEEYLLPYLAEMVKAVHAEGAFCVKHTDGNIYSILEMLLSTGIDGLNPIEPVAGMDLKTVKGLVGDRVCIMGNIDCGKLLTYGTPEDVDKAVAQAIRDAGEGGGFILSSSNSIHSSVCPANLAEMIRATHRHGVYRG